MNTEIITQDLGDGYYQHQVNISTYYYYESVSSPIALRESRVGRNGPPRLTSNLGKFEQYRLSQFVSHQDLKEEGRVVRLATVEKGKLAINPQAIQIFNKYGENEVAFVGNYGRRDAGKSFWYDKILNLSDFPGNNYSSNRREPGLYFWSIPYTKDNLKFFLVDYAGFEGKEQLTPDEEKLLDFELLLCEKLVVIPEPNDQEMTVLRPAYGHFLQSQRRFSGQGIQANKFSPYWPNEIYTLYRSSKPVKKEIDNIGILFPVYNFSILHDAANPSQAVTKQALLKSDLTDNSEVLNEKYVKMTSVVFKDIYEKMKGKEYDNIAFKGKNIKSILEQSRERINRGGNVKVDQIFDGVKGDIYDGTIQKCRVIYINEVSHFKKDPEPKPLDVLTDAFERGSSKAFKEFDKEVIDKKKHQEYEKKLQDQIDKIQAEILQDNKKKTYEYYNKKLPSNSSPSAKENFEKLKSEFNLQKSSKKLDHNDSLPVEERLESLFDGPQEIHLSGLSKKQVTKNLEKQIQLKKKELQSLKFQKKGWLHASKNPQDKQDNTLVEKHEVLASKVQQLKQQLKEKKAADTMTPEQKELLLSILRDNHSKNEQKLNEIRSKLPNEDKINELKDKLKKTAAKNSQIQSGLNPNPDRSLVDKSMADRSYASNRSVKSVIREIKGENIKKITIK